MSSDDKKKKSEEIEKGRRSDDTTVVFTDINRVLNQSHIDASDRPAALIALGGEINGTIYDLTEGVHSLGRLSENTFPLDFPGISRTHVKFLVQGDVVTIEDLGSRNGSFINNKKITNPTQLKKQDVVKIGSITLTFIPKGDPERLAYDQLNMEANTDGLTKCFNKAYFNNSIETEIKKSKSTGSPLSLIFWDIDNFKKLNDTYGHNAGDFVLLELAKVIRGNGIRDQDIFARYGGEEFVILLPRTNIKHGYEIAERVRSLIDNHDFVYEGTTLPVTVSVGIADYRQGVSTGLELINRADNAMYQSKNSGKNKVTYFKA